MLSESEASAFPTAYEKADSSAVPQNDISDTVFRGRKSFNNFTAGDKSKIFSFSRRAGPSLRYCNHQKECRIRVNRDWRACSYPLSMAALVSGASLLINPVFVREPLGEYEFFVGLSVLEYDSTIQLSITAGFIPPAAPSFRMP
jgi:hypothetical protein